VIATIAQRMNASPTAVANVLRAEKACGTHVKQAGRANMKAAHFQDGGIEAARWQTVKRRTA